MRYWELGVVCLKMDGHGRVSGIGSGSGENFGTKGAIAHQAAYSTLCAKINLATE